MISVNFSVFMPPCACACFAPTCTFCKYLSVSLLILHQWQTPSPATLVDFFFFFCSVVFSCFNRFYSIFLSATLFKRKVDKIDLVGKIDLKIKI